MTFATVDVFARNKKWFIKATAISDARLLKSPRVLSERVVASTRGTRFMKEVGEPEVLGARFRLERDRFGEKMRDARKMGAWPASFYTFSSVF